MTVLGLLLLPLLTALVLVSLRRRPSALGPVAVGGLVATLALGVWAAAAVEASAGWRWSPAIQLGLAVEGFGRVMVILVPAIAAPIVAYAAATEPEGRARLLALMVAFVGAMLLLVAATDFLTLLIAWELVGATSWTLIAHGWRDAGNARAATQAFVTTRFGDVGLYVAAGMAFAAAGGFAFADLGAAGRPALDVIAAGVLLAVAAKSAQVPFSPWLFSAMAGPTPVSALLHSATLVASGAYLLIRLAPTLEGVGWFLPAVAAVGLVTALAGGIVAVLQTDAKRVLAGSTSAQYGLMFVAIGAWSTAAGGAHLVAHAAFKSLLFLGAGIAVHAAGTGHLAALRLGSALPRVAALSAVGTVALVGVPPLGAAWTKEQIVAAAVHASSWLAAGVFAAGFLSALYATRYQLLAYGPAGADATVAGRGGHAEPRRPHHHPGRVEVASMAALAAITILLSVLWLPGAGPLVEGAAGGVLARAARWELVASLAALGAGMTLTWRLFRRGRLVTLGLPANVQSAVGDWLGLPAATRRLVADPILALSRSLARFDDRVVDAGVRAAARLPVLVSRPLARFDDRVVDAGVRGVARLASSVSHLFARPVEWTIDGAVGAIAAATMGAATGSRATDEAAIDAAVEGSARGVGFAGHASRRLQTGLAHHYYVIQFAGLAATVILLAVLL